MSSSRAPSRAASSASLRTVAEQRAQSARETMEVLYEVSQLLNTGLTREVLATCVEMVEDGANPEGLAAVVQELRKEAREAGISR